MRLLSTLFLALFALTTWAQDGYEIKIEIEGYEQPELYLAYYLGDKQYIQDTVQRAKDDSFTFSSEEALPGGIYLVVMAPNNEFFQILVDDKNQRFGVNTIIGAEQLEGTTAASTLLRHGLSARARA